MPSKQTSPLCTQQTHKINKFTRAEDLRTNTLTPPHTPGQIQVLIYLTSSDNIIKSNLAEGDGRIMVSFVYRALIKSPHFMVPDCYWSSQNDCCQIGPVSSTNAHCDLGNVLEA